MWIDLVQTDRSRIKVSDLNSSLKLLGLCSGCRCDVTMTWKWAIVPRRLREGPWDIRPWGCTGGQITDSHAHRSLSSHVSSTGAPNEWDIVGGQRACFHILLKEIKHSYLVWLTIQQNSLSSFRHQEKYTLGSVSARLWAGNVHVRRWARKSS